MTDQQIPDYPSNSKKSKENPPEPDATQGKVVQQVTKAKIIPRKKSLLERWFGNNGKIIGDYILFDIVIPAAKSTLTEMIGTGLDMLLYGERQPRSNIRRDRNVSHVSYSSYYDQKRDRDRYSDRRELSARARSRYDFDDIIIDTREEAENVLDNMIELIERFDWVTVADFYEMIEVKDEYTDRRWGWNRLNTARVERVRNGYVLVLPPPIPLDR